MKHDQFVIEQFKTLLPEYEQTVESGEYDLMNKEDKFTFSLGFAYTRSEIITLGEN